jgi:hypothetical protein
MAVAEDPAMVRRVGAILAIAVIVSLVLLLMWRVYVHHRNAGSEDEPTIVDLGVSAQRFAIAA